MKPIKFAYGNGGQLDFDGTTCATSLVQLGALLHTMSQSGEIATDAEGLESAGLIADSAIVAFANNIETIGELLAHADVDNVSRAAISDLGSLISTLGNYVRTLANMKTRIEDAEDIAKQRKGGK